MINIHNSPTEFPIISAAQVKDTKIQVSEVWRLSSNDRAGTDLRESRYGLREPLEFQYFKSQTQIYTVCFLRGA